MPKKTRFCNGANGEVCRRGSGGGAARVGDSGVCGHCARRRVPSGSPRPEAASRAADSLDVGRAGAETGNAAAEWADRPVTGTEISSILTDVGCGKSGIMAPLVELRRGPSGTAIVTVAASGSPKVEPSGALEIVDPFATSDEESVVQVNGRFLQDALKAQTAAQRKTMTASDLAISDNSVSINGVEVRGLDGHTMASRAAANRVAEIEQAAHADGVTVEHAHQALRKQFFDELGLNSEQSYPSSLAHRIETNTTLNVLPEERDYFRDILEHAKHEYRRAQLESGSGLTAEEWARSNARRFRENEAQVARSAAHSRQEDHLEVMQTQWAAEHDIDLPQLRETAKKPFYGKTEYPGPSVTQTRGIMNAKALLAAAGDIEWDTVVPAGDFAAELQGVLPAASRDHDRPVLSGVHFGQWAGRQRMTTCDSHQLASTCMSIPDALTHGEHLLSSRDLEAFTNAYRRHAGQQRSPVPLGVSQGQIEYEHSRERIINYKTAAKQTEVVTTTAPTVALQAGQVKVATRGTEGDFPKYATFFPPESQWGRAITLPSSQLGETGLLRKAGNRPCRGGGQQPVRLRLHHENGQVQSLTWAVRGESGGSVMAATSRHRHISPESHLEAEEEVGINPIDLANALRFAAGPNQSDNIEIHRWDRVKPVFMVPQGSPVDPSKSDRVALVMPVRTK